MVTTAGVPGVLDRESCERSLRAEYTGRVGFVDEGHPQVLPVNYVYADGAVVFQTGPGAKLDVALSRDEVAFEIDGTDDEEHSGWSVLVVGYARVLEDMDELAWAQRLPLRPWGLRRGRPFWACIDPTQITGRRFG